MSKTNKKCATALSLVETVNSTKAREILFSNYEYPMKDIDNNQFLTILEYATSDCIRRNYKTAEDYPTGRIYSNGLATIVAPLRAYLCKDDFVDLDIKRCYPNIIVNLAKKLKYDGEVEPLVNYINNPSPSAELKKNVCACIFGSRSKFNADLQLCITGIIEFLYESIEEGTIGKKMPTRSMSITNLLQTEEKQIVDKAFEVITNCDIEVQANVYDGLIVDKSISDTVLAKVNKAIAPYEMIRKEWQPVELKTAIELECFDWNDNDTINTLLDSSGSFDSLQHLHAKIGRLILKTIRMDSKGYIVKKPDSCSEYMSKLPDTMKNLEFTVGDKQIAFTTVLKKYTGVINVKGVSTYTKQKGYFSNWKGFAFTPVETVDSKKTKPFIEFIEKCIGANNKAVSEYIFNWLAYIIQNPGGKTEVAIILSGFPGTGKSTLLNFLYEKLFGAPVTYKDAGLGGLTDRFNSDIEGRVLGMLEELKSSVNSDWKADLDTIKDIITGRFTKVEAKYQDKRTVQNGLNILGFTNYSNTIPFISGNERRYMLHEISAEYREDHEYFKRINKSLTQEVANHVGTWLLKREVTKEDVIAFPMTTQNQEQVFRWLPAIEKSLYVAYVLGGKEDKWISTADIETIGREYRIAGIEKMKGKLGYDLKRLLGARCPSKRKYLITNSKTFMIKDSLVALTEEFISEMTEEPLID